METLLPPGSDIYSILPRVLGIWAVTYGAWKYVQAKRSPLNALPTVGYSGVLTSYITAFKWIKHGPELLQEGYDKYRGQPFKVPSLSRWIVVLSGVQHIDDMRRASSDVLSFREAIGERFQIKYTLGRAFENSPYHISVIRTPLTRNLVSRFDDITDEIVESFKDYIPLTEDWTAVPAYAALMHIICRTSNRFFVGLPLCRDPAYNALHETFTIDVGNSARIINCFPDFLKPLVGRYLTTVPRSVKRVKEFLGPTLEERLAQEKLHGPDWEGKPNDLISWLIDTATHDFHHTVHDLALRILSVNFAAIHTSTMTLTQALYDLAIHPEYVKEMREEAEAIMAEDGWTKSAMQRMRKIDSFMKESQRLNVPSSLGMVRTTLEDWTMSDGTVLPVGTAVGAASDAMNRDEETFPDAHTFKGFRFAEMREGDGELDSIKHQMVSLSIDHITFGHGRHACPGRFFAVNEIKAMFAHILLNYDVQLPNGSMERPPNFTVEGTTVPSRRAKVMFRKRRV